jgi:hypothetical protein
MAQQWIPFQHKVRQRLGFLLSQASFVEEKEKQTDEGYPPVRYQRLNPDNGEPQVLVFDGLDWTHFDGQYLSEFNWLRVFTMNPPVGMVGYLKQFAPQPSDADIYSLQGWKYTNEQELDQCIEEIAALVRQKFLLKD